MINRVILVGRLTKDPILRKTQSGASVTSFTAVSYTHLDVYKRQEYTADEISKEMLRHGFYDFSGSVSYDYIQDDNMLVVSFQKHAKG